MGENFVVKVEISVGCWHYTGERLGMESLDAVVSLGYDAAMYICYLVLFSRNYCCW